MWLLKVVFVALVMFVASAMCDIGNVWQLDLEYLCRSEAVNGTSGLCCNGNW